MKFSVIVPVYNCTDDLPACVGSVLCQSESDLELLLVDDGSTDGCAELCDQLAEQDVRIRVFHKQNGGASSARNLGLTRASGEYILFFDGDDTVEPDLLERVSAALSEASPQMVIFGMSFDYYNADGRLKKSDLLSVKHAAPVSSEEICAAFSEYFDDNALSSACNKVFSGAILRVSGLRFSEEMTLYEDLDFVLQYLRHCKQIACLDRALYHYRLPLRKTYVNPRMLHLENLQSNLELLIRSVLALNTPNAAQRAADLCAQLFDQHLMTASYTREEMPQTIAAIRGSAALQALSCVGIVPSEAASPSWSMIVRGEAPALYASLKKRKLLCRAKQIVIPALKTIGLYH